jgi:hypothetical protein
MAKPTHFDEQPGVAGNGATPPPGAGADAGGEEPKGIATTERESLYEHVKEQLSGANLHDEEIQYELGRWVHLLETDEVDLKRGPLPKAEVLERLVRTAGAAIKALLSDKPELVFARTLRVQTEIALLRHNGWLTRSLIRLTGGSPLLTVCLGTFLAMVLGLGAAALSLHHVGAVMAFAPLDAHVPTAVAAAYLGGLVSVMSRLHGFARIGDFEHVFLFVNALARPLIGAISGIFAYAALASGFIPLDQELIGTITPHQVWTIGFVAGFSERLAKDLVSRSEQMLASTKKP